MPQFFYKAKSGPGQVNTGYIQADTLAQAVSQLTASGQMPIEVKAGGKPDDLRALIDQTRGNSDKISPAALLSFTRQLADLLDAGIPLLRCVELYCRQRQFPAMVKAAQAIGTGLQQGKSLSVCLALKPQVFSPMYIHVVRAAEASGRLPVVLDRLAQSMDQDMQMQAKVRSSLLYPAIIMLVGVLTIFVLMSFVLPRMTMMFDDFDATLPFLTRVVVAISQVFAATWWLMLLAAGIGVWWIKRFLSTPAGRMSRDLTVLKVPLLRSFIENTQLGRFARTLGMLLESGVPVSAALEIVSEVVDNAVLNKEVKAIAVKVKGGMALAQAVRQSPLFPPVAVDLVSVGQESGRLEKGFYKLAAGCERSAQDLAQAFVTILGPAVLVVVVGIVGFMIVAMLLPMLQMNLVIN